MTFEIRFSKAGDRDLSKLPSEVLVRIVKALEKIAGDPLQHIQKMKGEYDPPQYKFICHRLRNNKGNTAFVY